MKAARISLFGLLLCAPIGVCGCEPLTHIPTLTDSRTPTLTLSGTISRWLRGASQITAEAQMGVVAAGPIA